MQKPNNYDGVQASGDFIPVRLGGHHLVIKQVQEQQTKTGKDMIVVLFVIASGDDQAEYFMKEFQADIRPDKKWPRNGRQYIVVTDSNGDCSKSFKTFISCIEKSNSGFKTEWGDNFCNQFKNKKIGGVFGEVENEYNGKVSMRHELRWFCDDNKAADANVPAAKYLPNHNKIVSAPVSADEFMSIPDGSEEEIPF